MFGGYAGKVHLTLMRMRCKLGVREKGRPQMGASYIGGGLTAEKSKSIEDVRAVVESFRDQIAAKLDDIDAAGFFEDEETAVDDLIASIVEGVKFIDDSRLGDPYVASWEIPGNDALYFLTFGGMSWGDSPFEEFDAVCFAGEAAAALPEFGRAVGILGGGIRLDYGA
jgi:hypothetical protein